MQSHFLSLLINNAKIFFIYVLILSRHPTCKVVKACYASTERQAWTCIVGGVVDVSLIK